MKKFRIQKNEHILIYLSNEAVPAVKIAASNLCKDLSAVLDVTAEFTDNKAVAKITIQTDTDFFIQKNCTTWEAYCLSVGSEQLNIIGSDRRGTIYGIYELSKKLGVSPWYWFADVPINKKAFFELEADYIKTDYPSVKYRGIFINDEEELEAWAIEYMKEKTIGPKTYEKIFELLLRLKANYIWPAMHVNAFNTDPQNGYLANQMGIVVGTSHCDMLLRSNQNEWKPWVKSKGYEGAEYDYSIEGRNREIIQEYWRESLEQNSDYEVCYTMGMRGIHDSGFVTKSIADNPDLTPEERDTAKVQLLRKVIEDQEKLIKETTHKDNTLQTFIPYKEVLSLYDKGLEVPENITLIWANDNFGYMRRYPNEAEQKRPGGNGLYYHASYWAHPGMSYLFFNSTPLSHTKNELRKAYDNGIRNIWVLNVGAIKPLEIDISFYFNYAWEINRNEETTANVADFISQWINSQFSSNIGDEAADIYTTFSQLANVRKVEHMKANVFSQTAFGNEAAKRMLKYKDLFYRTKRLHDNLPAPEKEAFFQLFAMKIYASYFINASFYYADRSTHMYNNDNMYKADFYTALCRKMDGYKRMLLLYYNKVMCGGKWNKILTPEEYRPPCMALYPACKPALVKSNEILDEEIEPTYSELFKAETGFCENDGYISINASHYDKCDGWLEIKHLGRFEGSLMEADNGAIEYTIQTVSSGSFDLEFYRFPSLNSTGRIRVGICIDNNEMQIIESLANDEWRSNWKNNVLNNVDKLYLKLPEITSGKHTLKICAIDKYVAFSKIVIYTNGVINSNLGPSESFHPLYNPNPKRLLYKFEENFEQLDSICSNMFECTQAPLPDVIFADKASWRKANIFVKNKIREQANLGYPKYQNKDYLNLFGSGVFQEKSGAICIETEYALENSENAYSTADSKGVNWEHTQSETNGRTGLAMHIPADDLFWDNNNDTPSLNYKIDATGGKYNIWLLLKYDDGPNAHCSIMIDDNEILQSDMYAKGRLFNYGTKQNWLWMIVAEADIPSGIHTFSIYARACQFRIDRVYLTKTEEDPPIDAEWVESVRA